MYKTAATMLAATRNVTRIGMRGELRSTVKNMTWASRNTLTAVVANHIAMRAGKTRVMISCDRKSKLTHKGASPIVDMNLEPETKVLDEVFQIAFGLRRRD